MTGKELKVLISELGITQQSIADCCNVSRITLLKWLNRDELAADIETRIKAAVILEIANQIEAIETETNDAISKATDKITNLKDVQESLEK